MIMKACTDVHSVAQCSAHLSQARLRWQARGYSASERVWRGNTELESHRLSQSHSSPGFARIAYIHTEAYKSIDTLASGRSGAKPVQVQKCADCHSSTVRGAWDGE